MHLQRHIEQLDQVVLDQSKRMDGLERTVRRLTDKLESLQQRLPDSEGSIEDEKPPHY